jgi:hypothetical protein
MVETVMDVILDVIFSPAVLVETVMEISSLFYDIDKALVSPDVKMSIGTQYSPSTVVRRHLEAN